MSLASLLPKPKNEAKPAASTETPETAEDASVRLSTTLATRGRNVEAESRRLVEVQPNTVEKEYDEDGQLKYDVLARVGHSSTRVLQTSLTDMQPAVGERHWVKPPPEEIARQAAVTRAALEKALSGKIRATQAASQDKAKIGAVADSSFVKLTTSDNKQRVVRVVEAQKDPLQPPKFHHKRIPRPPPSPPAPVLHSPPRKVTKEEQEAWRIPPCISNWKNAKGYTIPLDKRLAADGRGLIEHGIGEGFASFAEALYVAEGAAKEEVEKRAAVAGLLADQQRRQTEDTLRALAEQARREKSRIAAELHREVETNEEVAGREQMRKERLREHERDIRLSRMGPEQRAKVLARDSDRDISERVALGGSAAASAFAQGSGSAEVSMFDQRLFDQTQGIASGLGDEDAYNLYTKPLFGAAAAAATAHMIYRPTIGHVGADDPFDEEEEAGNGPASHGRKGLGAGSGQPIAQRTGPVEFERDPTSEAAASADPFGLDQLLQEAKRQKRQ